MNKPLTGKNILVTAGPTWVAIDRVRVITNIFTGKTGSVIARKARDMGARVTLLLGPGKLNFSRDFFKGIKVIQYYYFDELLELMKREVSKKYYDAVIHSASVADYMPVRYVDRKISSEKKDFTITLKPTFKIITQIKRWDPHIFLVQFKLEAGKSLKGLCEIAYQSMLRNKADVVVANDLNKMGKSRHEAYIMDLNRKVIKVNTHQSLAFNLLRIIRDSLT